MLGNFRRFIFGLVLLFLLNGCSSAIESIVISSMGSRIGDSSGGVITGENDPELMGDAFPFLLKTSEMMLSADPENVSIRVNTVRAFTVYASQWLELDAQIEEEKDYKQAQHLKKRAGNLYLRAKNYGLEGLELINENFLSRLSENDQELLDDFDEEEAGLLAWTSIAWAAYLGTSDNQLEALGDLPRIKAMINKAYELNPDMENGMLHEFYIQYYASGFSGVADARLKAQFHYKRALELAKGKKCSPYLTWAGSYSKKEQNKSEFIQLLDKALAIDAEKYPESRLVNLLCQKKARWLKSKVDDYFL